MKQACFIFGISNGYAFKIFYEHLEWKMEWKDKEMQNVTK